MKFSQGSNGAEGINAEGEEVDVFTLSELPRSDIVKTDAAGAEPSILRGLNYTSKHIVLGVDLALVDRYGDSEASLWKEVERLGMEKKRLNVEKPLNVFLLSRSE